MTPSFSLAGSLAAMFSASVVSASHAAPLSPISYFSQAAALTPLNTGVDTGLLSSPVAIASSPIQALFYDPSAATYIASDSIVTPPPPPDVILVSTGSSRAAANLARGELHAAAGAKSVTVGGNPSLGFPSMADAIFGDTLFFSATGASGATLTTVEFSVHVDGMLTNGPFGYDEHASLSLYVGNSPSYKGFFPTPINVHNFFDYSTTWRQTPSSPITTAIDDTIKGSFTFIGPIATVPVYAELFSMGQEGFADFGNTATFSFTPLPPDVSYTSASGEFLTTASLPISEPGSLILLAALLGWAVFRSYRPEGATH